MVCSVFCIGSSVQPAFTLHSLGSVNSSACRLLSPLYTILKKMDSPLIKDNLAHVVAWNRADLGRSRLDQCEQIDRMKRCLGTLTVVHEISCSGRRKKKLLTRGCVSCLRLDGSRVAQNGHRGKLCTPPYPGGFSLGDIAEQPV